MLSYNECWIYNMTMAEKKYDVILTKQFNKKFIKLSREDRNRVVETIRIMKADPSYPSLRTKKFKTFKESSVNMDIRILWYFRSSQVIVVFDVGHHDVIRKYNKHKF